MPPPRRAERDSAPAARAVLAALVLVGAAFRLTGLTTHSLWFDEVMTVWVAGQDDLAGTLARDRNPPLAFWLLGLWTRVFGTDEAVVRLLPALVSTLTLAIVAVVLPRLLPGPTALATVALLALSPFSIWYGQEVRTYWLLELGAALAFLGLLQLTRRGGGGDSLGWCGAATGTALAFGAHYAAWVIVFQMLVTAAWVVRDGGWRRAAAPVSASALGFAVWLPWIATTLPRQLANGWGHAERPTPRALAELPFRLLLVEPDALPPAFAWLPYAMCACIGVALGRASWPPHCEDRRAALLLGLWAAPVIGCFAVSRLGEPTFHPRYLIAAELPLLASVAIGLRALPARASAWMLAALLAGAASLALAHKTHNLKEDFRGACARVAAAWRHGDHVATLTGTFDGFSQAALVVYLRGRPEILAATLPERALDDPPRDVTRLHLVFREAPYAWPAFERLSRAWRVVAQAPMSHRVQYLLLERRR